MEIAARKEALLSAFHTLDVDGKGTVPTEVLHLLLTTLGNRLSNEEIKEFLQEADSGGVVNYKYLVEQVLFAS